MIIVKKSIFISTFTAVLTLVLLALPAAAQSYNAAADFSDGNNPSGAWSYGWSYGVGAIFHLDTTNTAAYAGLALGGWLGNVDSAPGAGYPYALKNFTANPVANNGSTIYQPGQLGLQPGSSNEESIVRWTAPFSGAFTIAGTFSGLDLFGDSADVHVLLNGAASLFNSTVIGTPPPASFSVSTNLTAGNTLDFVVGNGGNGINDDTTVLAATIVAVPEPGPLSLAAMSLAGLLSFHFRKLLRLGPVHINA